jgi:alpha/beta superfamily hydrolase
MAVPAIIIVTNIAAKNKKEAFSFLLPPVKVIFEELDKIAAMAVQNINKNLIVISESVLAGCNRHFHTHHHKIENIIEPYKDP